MLRSTLGYGGSMKRMVRILRSTVMVRVGGGWETLEVFNYLGKQTRLILGVSYET